MTTEASSGSAVLTAITRYPVKSCRGQELTEAVVEPWGLAGDRRWMVVDEAGVAVTARDCPGLLRVVPEVTGAGLLLGAPGQPPLQVVAPAGEPPIPVRVWNDVFEATLGPGSAADWFSAVAGRAVRLVYFDDPRRRPTDPVRTQPGDVVSLADGYPVLLASAESLAELNGWVFEGACAADGPLSMSRFRPNLVVSGSPAWAEDRWRRVRIGTTIFRSAKGCDRCVLTLVDPATGRRGKEPLYSLARRRQWDHKTWFAVNLIPENAGSPIRLGDSVQVLEESSESGPQR